MACREPHRPHTSSVMATGDEHEAQTSPCSATSTARSSAGVVNAPSFANTLYTSRAIRRIAASSSLAIRSPASDEGRGESVRDLRPGVHGDRDLLHPKTERGPDCFDIRGLWTR